MPEPPIVYPGPAGAHSATAAETLFPERELRALATFSAVVEAVASREAEAGVLPIESSITGSVAETHDLLYEAPLSIQAEAIVPVHHVLIGPAQVPLDELRVVLSHPVALDQCRRLLARLPHVTAVAATTTAEAAAEVARRGDPTQAAIASPRAASLYGLAVLEDDVGDHPEARTRFVAVATSTRIDGGDGPWRTAFSFVTDHRPGALHRALEAFAAHGVDLVQLVSRPLLGSRWRYRFDAVLAGHPLAPDVAAALREARSRTRELRVFGSYAAAGDETTP